MNKKLLALAAAGALVAPLGANAASNTTLYGSVRVVAANCDAGAYNLSYGQCDVSANKVWSIKNSFSRLGVKGSEDLGGGLKAIYEMEFGIDPVPTTGSGTSTFDVGNRPKWVGLTGNWGTFTVGQQWTASYLFVGAQTDIFNDAGNLMSQEGARVGPAIAYVSPNISGLTLVAAGVVDGASFGGDKKSDIDAYQLAGDYVQGPLNVGFVYQATPATSTNDTLTGIGASWNFGPGSLHARYDSVKNDSAVVPDSKSYGVAVSFPMGNEVLMAGYGKMSTDKLAGVKQPSPTISRVEWQHNFSKSTRTWLAAINYDPDTSASSSSVFEAGIRHDF